MLPPASFVPQKIKPSVPSLVGMFGIANSGSTGPAPGSDEPENESTDAIDPVRTGAGGSTGDGATETPPQDVSASAAAKNQATSGSPSARMPTASRSGGSVPREWRGMPRKGFFTDTTLCIGCKACEVACKEWNQLPTDGLTFTAESFDNTSELNGTTWRHV